MRENNHPIEIDDREATHFFSNLVSFNVNAEEICMGFGIRSARDANLVEVHSYMHVTVPHFLRFAEMVNQQVQLLIDRGVISRETEQ